MSFLVTFDSKIRLFRYFCSTATFVSIFLECLCLKSVELILLLRCFMFALQCCTSKNKTCTPILHVLILYFIYVYAHRLCKHIVIYLPIDPNISSTNALNKLKKTNVIA